MSIKFGLSQRLWVYYNKEMIRIFGPQKEGENYIMKSFIICTLHLKLLLSLNPEE
jgi:hypothetical protein